MLKATGVKKSYDSLDILKGIDIEILSGEVVSIVGSSGAGKTTLLQILGTLDRPDSGKVQISDVDPFTLSSKKLSAFRNQSIGFVFQFHQLLPEFSALENVILPALIKGVSMSEAVKNGEELLELIGLSARKSHRPSELSGGEQQRIAVCRALINRPKIILADEPSGNLDSTNSEELHNLFFRLRDQFGQTFVIVTHNEQLANMADRKLVMKDGLIVNS
jgi:lipoprotein-releasing system ATP-binding protein